MENGPAFLALIVAEGRPRALASFRGLSGQAIAVGHNHSIRVRLATDLVPLAVLSLLFQRHGCHVHCRTGERYRLKEPPNSTNSSARADLSGDFRRFKAVWFRSSI
jgi:hypothetical protein